MPKKSVVEIDVLVLQSIAAEIRSALDSLPFAAPEVQHVHLERIDQMTGQLERIVKEASNV